MAFIISAIQTKKLAMPIMVSSSPPEAWLSGYTVFMMGSASTLRPTPMGRAMTAAMRIEFSAMRLASPRWRRAIAAAIAGTTEMVSGVMKLAGRL